MKNLTLLLFLLIGAIGCMLQEPAVEPVRVTRLDEAATLPPSETTPVPSVSSAATEETDITATPAFSPQVFLWVIERGQKVGESYLTKMTADGQALWRRQFEPGTGIGIDPHDGGIWALQQIYTPDFETRLVKIDANGDIIQQITGYEAGLFAVDPNDGSLWLSLVNEDQIVKLNREGVETMRLSGWGNLRAMVVHPGDSGVWLAGGDSRKIIKLSQNGERLVTQDTPGFFSASPQQIAIDPRDRSVWHGGMEDVFKLAADGSVLKQVRGFESPVAVAVDPRDGSVWVSEFGTTTSAAIVKLDQNGSELLRTPLGSSPQAISVHPEDGSVWVGVEGALIKLSSDGFVQTILPNVHRPEAVMMATVLASSQDVIASAATVVNRPLPDTAREQTPTPMPVTPTPVANNAPAAEICSTVGPKDPADCQALVQLLHQIDPNLLSTLMSESCLWPRIICDEDGHLIHLHLSNYQLDSLPPEIGRLTNLQLLNLDGNNLSNLPPEIGELAELQVLSLHSNNLNTVPPEIGQLSNLQRLSLSYNPLNSLPAEIGQLSNLQELDLWAVELSTLPPEVGNLTKLQRLNVSAELDVLPPEIGRLANLIMLDIPSNNLITLPPEIGNLASLARLDVSSNQLSSLPAEIGNLTNLHNLDLSHNRLNTLPPEIGNLANLEKLILAYNELDTVPPEMANLTNLREFCLYYNLAVTALPPQVEALKEQTVCFSYEY